MSVRSLGQLTLDLVARVGGFTGPMDRATKQSERQFKKLERDAKKAAAGIAAVTAAAAAAAAGAVAYTRSAAMSARELQNQAQVANASTQEFQRIAYATEQFGISQEKLSDILKDVNDRIGDFIQTGGGPMADFFENIAPKVGVTAEQFRQLSGPQALQLYYDSLEKANLAQSDLTFYLEAMASDTTALIPLLRNGGKELSAMADEADRLGIVLDEVQIDNLTEFARQTDRISAAMSAASQVAASELAPALTQVADNLVDIASAYQQGEYDTQIRIMQQTAIVAAGAAGAYGAYRTAIAAATIAQWAFNAAARANPIGMLVTAAGIAVGALYAFREELIGSAQAAERVANRVDDLTNAINTNSEAAVRSQLVNLTGQMFDLERQAIAARERIDEVTQSSASRSGSLGIAPGNTGEQARAYQELARLVEEQEAVNQSADRLRGIMQALRTEGTTPTANSVRDLSEVSSEAARQGEQLERAYESLLDRLYPIEASQRRFREEMELLDLAAQAGKVHDLADAQERLRESFGGDQDWQSAYGFDGMGGEGEDGGYWERWLESAESAFTDFDQMAANTAESFQRGFGNAFESMVFDSESAGDAMRNLAQGMARSVVNALGQMAAQWIAYQAVQMATGRSMEAASVAGAVAAGTGIAAAYAPAAAMASLATLGANSAPAMAGIASTHALSKTLALTGMAHDGIDSIPREGTWLLDKGERVLNAPQASKLDRFLDQQQAQDRRRDGGVTVNIIENPERAGQRETTVNSDGREEESLFVADIYGDGPRSRAIQNAFGLQRRGR